MPEINKRSSELRLRHVVEVTCDCISDDERKNVNSFNELLVQGNSILLSI